MSHVLILDGKKTAADVRGEISSEIREAVARGLRAPGLAVILVGEDPASQVYVRNKERACEQAGIRSLAYRLPATVSQTELLELIASLNSNPEVDGILLQLPLPEGDAEQFGAVLDKDSALTECVSKAVDALRENGTLDELVDTWLSQQGAPELS